MRYFLGLVAALVLLAGAALPAAAQTPGPAVVVTSPQQGQVIDGTSVTVTFQVAYFQIVPTSIPLSEAGKHPEVNRPGQGHVHFVLDLLPLVTHYDYGPYTFTDLPPGQHQLMVELVNNDHSPFPIRVMQIIQFQTTGSSSGTSGQAPNAGPTAQAAMPMQQAPATVPVTGASGASALFAGLLGLSAALCLALGGTLNLGSSKNKRQSRDDNRPR